MALEKDCSRHRHDWDLWGQALEATATLTPLSNTPGGWVHISKFTLGKKQWFHEFINPRSNRIRINYTELNELKRQVLLRLFVDVGFIFYFLDTRGSDCAFFLSYLTYNNLLNSALIKMKYFQWPLTFTGIPEFRNSYWVSLIFIAVGSIRTFPPF